MTAGPETLTLHIGLPKTGTTLLQHRVFRRAEGLRYLHRAHDEATFDLMVRLRTYAKAGAALGALRRRGLVARLLAIETGGRPLLLSDEGVAFKQAQFWRGKAAEPERVADRLAQLARALDASGRRLRVLLGVRRQDRWLASSYADKAGDWPDLGQADFDRRLVSIAAAPRLAGGFAWLDYARAHGALAAALGAENVMVTSLERMIAEPAGVAQEIRGFVGATRLSLGSMKRAPNALGAGEGAWRLPKGALLRLSPVLAQAVRGRFEAANRAAAAQAPLGFAP
jgi:hypothetical protein